MENFKVKKFSISLNKLSDMVKITFHKEYDGERKLPHTFHLWAEQRAESLESKSVTIYSRDDEKNPTIWLTCARKYFKWVQGKKRAHQFKNRAEFNDDREGWVYQWEITDEDGNVTYEWEQDVEGDNELVYDKKSRKWIPEIESEIQPEFESEDESEEEDEE